MPNNQETLSICMDSHHCGNHFIIGTNQSQILIFDVRKEEKGEVIQTIGSKGKEPGQFTQEIYGVCVNNNGTLLTTDFNNNRIQMFC